MNGDEDEDLKKARRRAGKKLITAEHIPLVAPHIEINLIDEDAAALLKGIKNSAETLLDLSTLLLRRVKLNSDKN